MISADELKQAAKEASITHVAVINTEIIRFHEDFRKACERNACGRYDTNWMGPPAIGPIGELRRRVMQFRRGLLLQTVHPLAGSFNMKGMLAAAGEHQVLFRKFLKNVKRMFPGETLLPLDAGCCSFCDKCAYQDSVPCRNPEEAVSSIEAYGMDVAALMKSGGLQYNHGKKTVGFVGLVLFDPY